MCLITFSWQPSAPERLILAANRDEFYQRPTRAMMEWPEQPGLYAGKDLQQGGSWLGVRQQRFAALTNIRAPGQEPDKALSRGQLVTDFLTSSLPAAQWLQQLTESAARYGLFNLLCYDGEQLWYCHNHPDFYQQPLAPGLYALSNAHLDTPWPKAEDARQQLASWLQETNKDALPTRILNRSQPYPQAQLPATGVPPEWESLLSSQFIQSPVYGTRCSTGLIMEQHSVLLEEISWGKGMTVQQHQRYHFPI